MAASSSTSSSAAKQYDVFISFRGEDTRHNFTSHLYSALSRNSIRAYIDHKLNKGDDISPALIQAIQGSYGSLVVFSENYASSKWCLNELLKILECRKHGHFIIPVFYKIDPSHVRNQTASYGEAFTKHEQHFNNDKNMLQKWKAALIEAANIAGWDSQSRNNRNESELIQSIVKDVLEKLDHIYQPSECGLVGIDKHCEKIESWLQRFPVVGIWGMGGIGKTTIAKVVFDKLSSQYDSCCFFENVREESQRSGLKQFHDKLFCDLLKDDVIPINPHKAVELKHAMRRLSSKKAIIVLDDVNSSKQLKILERECNCLGPKSRVIITTRDKHLLIGLSVQHVIYEVERLDFEESLQLFRLNAFNENYPDIGYEELSEQFVDYAKGTPLALKVLGSFLLSKSRKEWESAWQKLNKIPNEDIGKVLRLSFDDLNHEEKQIFLDIACFLKGENKEKVISLADSFGFYGPIGIRTLQNKALITISYENIVQMHDLIQKMGSEIVRKECIEEPGRRSRLLDPEEVYDVLKYNKGTDAIQGIILDMSQIKDLHLSVKTFKKMINLRFLKFYSYNYGESCKVHLPVNIQTFFDKLRCFHWERYPSQSLPSNFCVEKLVELHMPHSHIKKLWNGVQDLVNLKSLDLSECDQLIELPDFTKAFSLRSVDLAGCTNLHHIHPSILSLHTLEILDLEWCKELKSLQSEVHLKSLKYLNLMNCSSLKEFSLTSEAIRDLVIEGTAIEILPSSIGRCCNLRDLTLCDSFENLPGNLSKLTALESLCVIGCRELDTLKLHMVLGSLPFLRELTLIDCPNLSRVTCNIEYLSELAHFEIRHCSGLLHIFEFPICMNTLFIINCTSLKTIYTPALALYGPCRCFMTNCVSLDEYSAIIKLVINTLDYFKLMDAASFSMYGENRRMEIFWPGNRVPSCFEYRTTQKCISFEICPTPDLLGFAFCCILSPEFLPNQGKNLVGCGCNCYLEDSWLAKFSGPIDFFNDAIDTELISDHVYSWYSSLDNHTFYDAMKGKSAISQSTIKLIFKFHVYANRHQSITTENGIKECGVWPMYSHKSDGTYEEEQFFDPTSENFKPSLIPMELEFDELGSSRVGIGVASSVFDHQDEDISTQNAGQYLPEINPSCLLIGFSGLDCSASQMEVNFEFELGNKTKRCRDMDDNQLHQRKKSNRCQDIDELSGGAGTSGIGVGCFEFDCVNHYDLQPLTHTNTMSELVFQLLPIDFSRQNGWLDSTQMISTCLLDGFSKLDNSIKECAVCPEDTSEYHNSKDQMGLNLELELALGNKSKRCQCELEADEQQQFPLTKKLEESILQLVPLGLELELNAKSGRDLENKGIEVGGSSQENQQKQEQLLTNKGIEKIYLPSTSYWNPDAE